MSKPLSQETAYVLFLCSLYSFNRCIYVKEIIR